MEIGKKLKDARMKSGFTQEMVAEKINVSRQTISNWENEKSYPDIISVIELSSLYSISLDDLLKEEKADVTVLKSLDNWFGVTYQEDKQSVIDSIKELISAGIYPDKLY